jgi:hypothetical protein
MKYYKHHAESEYGEGTAYVQIDEDKDLVVKQVEVYGSKILLGEWTGSSLVGRICDQPASLFELTDEDAITKAEFDAIWTRGTRMRLGGTP